MKLTLAIAALILALVFSGAFYLRGLDPRPANLAMQGQFAEALAAMKDDIGDETDAQRLAEAYSALANSAAAIGLAYGQDADLLAYARHLRERPAPHLGGAAAPADVGALNGKLLSALDLAVAHVGTPDDRFYEFMLPLERAMAELGRLADPAAPASALRASDPATLMAASAAVALSGWGSAAGHSH